jgi:hypothetical protein
VVYFATASIDDFARIPEVLAPLPEPEQHPEAPLKRLE